MENKTMKSLLKVTALACMMMAASASAAINDNTLEIKGTVTPASCVPALSNGGEVDFGNTISEKLTQTDNQLKPQSLTLTITCQNAAKISLHMIDNNPGGRRQMVIKSAYADDTDSTDSLYQFGIGKDIDGQPVGAYSVAVVGNPSDNGNGVYVIGSTGGAWSSNSARAFSNGSGVNTYLSFTNSGTDINPSAITMMEMVLKISAAVASNSAVNMTDDINFDGNSTIVMTYL